MRIFISILLLFSLKVNAQSEFTVSCFSSFKIYDAIQPGINYVGYNTSFLPLVINYVNSRFIYEFAVSAEFYELRTSRLEEVIIANGFDNVSLGNYGFLSTSRIVPSVAIKYVILKNDKVGFYVGAEFAISNNFYKNMQFTAERIELVGDFNVTEIYTSNLSKNRFTKSYTLLSGFLINLESSGKYLLSIESRIGYLQLGKLELNMQKIDDSNGINRPDVPIVINLPTQVMAGAAIGIKYRFNLKEA